MVEPRSDFESASANTVSLENSGTKKNESHVTSAVNAPIFMPNRVRTGRATCCLVDNEENGVLEWPQDSSFVKRRSYLVGAAGSPRDTLHEMRHTDSMEDLAHGYDGTGGAG